MKASIMQLEAGIEINAQRKKKYLKIQLEIENLKLQLARNEISLDCYANNIFNKT